MSNIQKAFNLAIKYHKNQKYGNRPYIVHLMGVASQMKTDQEIIVALLHDIIEDTDCSPDLIKKEFGDEVLGSILLLTRDKKNTYSDYIQDIKNSKIKTVIKVKIADLRFNLSNNPKPFHRQRYEKALEKLIF